MNILERMFQIYNNTGPDRTMNLIMVGLDATGKTTALSKLELGDIVTTTITKGFDVDTVDYKNITFAVWDVGEGQEKIRPLWRHYYTNVQGLIFMVDSTDKARLDEAREELHKMLNEDEFKEIPLLVFANKQDLPNAMSTVEVAEGLSLPSNDRTMVQSATATTGDGLYQGLEWLEHRLGHRHVSVPRTTCIPLAIPCGR